MSRKNDKELLEILFKQERDLGGIVENTRNISQNSAETVKTLTKVHTTIDSRFNDLFKAYAGFSAMMKETSDSLKGLNDKIGNYTKLTWAMVALLIGVFIELLIVLITRIQL